MTNLVRLYPGLPLFRWIGGKSSSAKDIWDHCPKEFSEYREPFFGSGGYYGYVWRWFRFTGRTMPKFWINDLHPDLYEFYRWLRDDPDAVKDWLAYRRSLMPIADNKPKLKKAYADAKFEFANYGDPTALLFLLVYAHAQYWGRHRPNICTYDPTYIGHGIERLNEAKINGAREQLQDARLTNIDGRRLFQEPGEGVFIYGDPPFPSHGRIYELDWDQQQQIAFLDLLESCPHRFLISYGCSVFSLRQLQQRSFRVVHRRYRYRSTRAREAEYNEGQEVMIMNW